MRDPSGPTPTNRPTVPSNNQSFVGQLRQLIDTDPDATAGWRDALRATVEHEGIQRGRYLLMSLLEQSRDLGIDLMESISTPYLNSLEPGAPGTFPGDLALEKRIRALVRWNAVAMVVRANNRSPGIGGHLATYASAASLYEVGFNHFFRGKDLDGLGDQVYFQGHASPGIYARAFLEGRLDEDDLEHFRAEASRVGTDHPGLSSYPHPRLMPEFWEFPTVSMGLGPLSAIYQARHNRYVAARGLCETSNARVWAFLGDGECDEPEALGALGLAAREGLDNLTFVVSCNLQRLDGPVRGNGKVIQELEATFRGAGWNVIKVLWGHQWDTLFSRDHDGVLVNKLTVTPDGEFQRWATLPGAVIRREFFGTDPRLAALVEDLTDRQIEQLPRGGHDPISIHAAFSAAIAHQGQPTVILAHTVKGWALGARVEARNSTHQIKKMTAGELGELRDRLGLRDLLGEEPLDTAEPPYLRVPVGSPEQRYLEDARRSLGGPLPSRRVNHAPITLPSAMVFTQFESGSGTLEVSTTAAFVRLLRDLLRDPDFGARVVPIVPDEGRTFGLDPLFSEFGIYTSLGQRYTPVDAGMMLSYREAADGQVLEEGITEAGCVAAFQAAGTSYATLGYPTVPFYLFYAMFGLQRTGDAIWQLGDARAKGFMLGGTAGRTTLMGEGLQHQDGHSHLLAAAYPYLRAYDPAFAYEVAAIIHHGLDEMYGDNPQDVAYYLTLYNEPFVQPASGASIAADIVRGLSLFRLAPTARQQATIVFSGSAASEAIAAADELNDHGIGVTLFSATSYKALREEALDARAQHRQSFVSSMLDHLPGPLVAVSDYVTLVPDQISPFLNRPMTVLGTDGVGLSDNRQALREHFGIDQAAIVRTVRHLLDEEAGTRRENPQTS